MTAMIPAKAKENASPLPVKPPETMPFLDALREVMNGKKVASLFWGNGDYAVLREGWLEIFTTKDNQFHLWTISEGDLAATDWVVAKDTN